MSAVKWRAVNRDSDGGVWSYLASLGPVLIEVNRVLGEGGKDLWWYEVMIKQKIVPFTIGRGRCVADLERCKADAIACVERWRDSIRPGESKRKAVQK